MPLHVIRSTGYIAPILLRDAALRACPGRSQQQARQQHKPKKLFHCLPRSKELALHGLRQNTCKRMIIRDLQSTVKILKQDEIGSSYSQKNMTLTTPSGQTVAVRAILFDMDGVLIRST